ncbi:AMP-binding protein [Brachybacterium sp. DNPG3]
MQDPTPWLRPAPYDRTAASLAEHVDALARMVAGDARVWLGPFDPPAVLPEAFADAVLVVPTSGSTGTPKAVVHGLASLRASQDATAALLAADGTAAETRGHGFWLPLLPPTHIAGVQVIARALRTARVLGLERAPLPDPLPDLTGHFDAASFLGPAEAALEQAGAQGLPAFTSLVPTQLARIVTGTWADDERARSVLRGFAAVLVGGAATSPEVLAATRAAGIRIRTTYGSSETAGGCVYDRTPLPGVALALDAAPAPAGDEPAAEEGRLLISSPTLALGHLDPAGEEVDGGLRGTGSERVLITSDLARIDDGLLRILGRADDVIVTGGRKVLPQDVERAIEHAEELRATVRGCVVVGVDDPEWGQRIEALVTTTGEVPDAEVPGLVQRVLRAADLPGHAVPKAVHVIDELPLLGIGKIDRAAARRLAAARA